MIPPRSKRAELKAAIALVWALTVLASYYYYTFDYYRSKFHEFLPSSKAKP